MQVGALAGKYGARKVMIVYGGGSVLRSGLLDRVKQSLQKPVFVIARWVVCNLIRWIRRCMRGLKFAVVNRLIYCSR